MILLLILNIILLACIPINSTTCDTTYACVLSNHAYIFSSSDNNNMDNAICLAEYTYYVQILRTIDTHYFVQYGDLCGYIAKDAVQKVKGTPQCPFPTNIYLKTYSNYCNLRSSPKISTQSNIIASIAPKTELQFVGRIYGEEGVDFHGTTWYYVKYNEISGYIYSAYIDNSVYIPLNCESLSANNALNDSISPLSIQSCIILLICMSAPIGVIMFILFRPPKKQSIKKIDKKRTKTIKQTDNY